MTALDALLRPQSVAIVGASPNPGRATGVYNNLRKLGFTGRIYPVNPKYTDVHGLACFPTISALPEPVDCAVISVPAAHVTEVLHQCAARGVKAAVVLGSGFGEAGPAGRALQAEVAAIAQAAAIALCGPNCHGVINISEGVAVSAGTLPNPVQAGGLALIMQSGVILGNLIDVFNQRGIGFSYLISSGNEAVVGAAQYLASVLEDPRTKVVAMFLEGIRDPGAFRSALRRAAELGKPVVVVKTGRSEKGQQAALAHTGSLTGADAVIDAILREYGAVRVADLDELVETVVLFCSGSLPRRGLGVLTISGAGCGLISDLADELGVELANLSESTREALRTVLPDFGTVSNPLDVTGAVGERPGLFQACMDTWQSDPGIGTIAVALRAGAEPLGQGRRGGYYEMAQVAAAAARAGGKPVVCFTLGGPAYDLNLTSLLQEAGVPFLHGARGLLTALRASVAYTEFVGRQSLPSGVVEGSQAAMAEVHRILRDQPPGRPLTERLSKRALAAYGIAVTRELPAATVEAAIAAAEQIGFPVVVKVESPDIPHKTEVGGIRLGLGSTTEVAAAFEAVLASARQHRPDALISGVLIQEQVPAGVEMIVGARVDRQFGPVVMVGLGGIFVEILRDTALRPAPVTTATALAMIEELKGKGLLQGVRNRPVGDTVALADMIVRLSHLITDCADQVAEVDLNPVIVLPAGKGVRAADALIVPNRQSRDGQTA